MNHMTIRLAVSTFLLVVNNDHESILHRYGDAKPQSMQKAKRSQRDLLANMI